MEEFFPWFRSLAAYLVFLAALEQLLPKKQAAGGVRLFAGLVFLLLALQPFAGGTALTEQAAGAYRQLELEYDASAWKEELSGAKGRQLAFLFSRYEEAVASDILRMAERLGIPLREASAELGKDEASGQFGKVMGVRVVASSLLPEQQAQLRAALRSYYQLEDSEIEIWSVEEKR